MRELVNIFEVHFISLLSSLLINLQTRITLSPFVDYKESSNKKLAREKDLHRLLERSIYVQILPSLVHVTKT